MSAAAAAGDTVSTVVLVRPLYEAEMVTELDDVTDLVATVKFALVAPAETTTLEGILAMDVLLLARVMIAPPAGAGPLSVTVASVLAEPLTLDGLRVSADRLLLVVDGLILSDATLVTPAYSAPRLTAVVVATDFVMTLKVALVAPPGMVKDGGTLAAAELSLYKVTKAPPAGAGPSSATVACEVFPAETLPGLSVSALSAAGITLMLDCCWLPFHSAVMTARLRDATGLELMVKEASVAPAGIVKLAGVVAMAVLLLPSVIEAPPTGAGALRVTIPCEELPPITSEGLVVRNERALPPAQGLV